MAQAPNFSRSAGIFERLGVGGRSDAFYLYAARAARGFGDGFAAIILPAYLLEIGLNPFQIGIVATAALLGSAATTLAIGYLRPRYDVRTLLLVCAVLMIVTGIAIPNLQHLWFIAAIAFVGTMNPTTGDIGVHIPLEQASLAQGAADKDRTHVFAFYSLIGALSIAAGALAAGVPDWLVAWGMGKIGALQAMFYVYAALGVLGAVFYSRLPRATAKPAVPQASALGPSRRTVYKLAALFSLDAFASGFVVQSLLALWLFERFELSLSAASAFFFWSNVLAAFSYPVAAHIGKRFGLVNTMVFTHIPASICLILVAFCWNLPLAIFLLLVRAALSQMDVPTRTSYVMAIVTPPERTIAASFTAVPRSLASSVSPALAGAMMATSFTGLPLIISGCLKTVYDLALLFSFRHIQPPEETKGNEMAVSAEGAKPFSEHQQDKAQK
jgi:MFS family permease